MWWRHGEWVPFPGYPLAQDPCQLPAPPPPPPKEPPLSPSSPSNVQLNMENCGGEKSILLAYMCCMAVQGAAVWMCSVMSWHCCLFALQDKRGKLLLKRWWLL